MNDFHHSRAWRKVREAALRRDNYQCQMSKRYGRSVQGNTVHHILPVEQYPQYALKIWNLITVTPEWHNRLHGLKNREELSDEGQRLMRKVAKEQNIDISE